MHIGVCVHTVNNIVALHTLGTTHPLQAQVSNFVLLPESTDLCQRQTGHVAECSFIKMRLTCIQQSNGVQTLSWKGARVTALMDSVVILRTMAKSATVWHPRV